MNWSLALLNAEILLVDPGSLYANYHLSSMCMVYVGNMVIASVVCTITEISAITTVKWFKWRYVAITTTSTYLEKRYITIAISVTYIAHGIWFKLFL